MRDEFVIGRMRQTMKSHSDRIGDVFQELYERTIDFGAHPNEQAFLSNLNQEKVEERTELETVFLHADGPQLDHALKSTGQVGIWTLNAFQQIYRERFILLGVKERLEKLRERF